MSNILNLKPFEFEAAILDSRIAIVLSSWHSNFKLEMFQIENIVMLLKKEEVVEGEAILPARANTQLKALLHKASVQSGNCFRLICLHKFVRVKEQSWLNLIWHS